LQRLCWVQADDHAYAAGTVFKKAEKADFAAEEGCDQPAWIALRFDRTAMEAIEALWARDHRWHR